jgi:hypothetical protein
MKLVFVLFIIISLSSCVRTHDCLCVTTDAQTGNILNQAFEYKTTSEKAKIMCSKRNDDIGSVTTICTLQ